MPEHLVFSSGDDLTCPACHEPFVHLYPPTWNVGEFTSPDGFCRGDWIAIDLWCECCPHLWTLMIGEHKGTVRTATTVRAPQLRDLRRGQAT